MSAVEGFVHSIETAGTVDGPGLRYVIFVTGCPLQCLYCHNPDTHRLTNGKKMSSADLLAEIASYKDFLVRTNGGVTITGGEPMFQPEFVTEIFRGCHEIGVHTALDTSGFLGSAMDQAMMDVTDLVLLDIKSFNPETYFKVTNGKLQPTLDFAKHLAAHKKKMWVRCVLVPNLTDNLDDLEAMACFLKPLGNVEKIEILPFHKMGEAKWQSMGLAYKLKDTQPPSAELVTAAQDIFRKHGFVVV